MKGLQNKKYEYDPEEAYSSAMAALEQAKENVPVYNDRYDRALQTLYEEITQRPKFSYDPNEDALYQGYKQSYAQQGRMAMEDTMGQAAALTGGYGSSYAQSVGQQQYAGYLQRLSEIYPETYAMAYQQYLREGEGLQDEYGKLSAMADEEYEKYADRLASYYRELEGLQERADIAYDRAVAAEQERYDRAEAAEQKQYDRDKAAEQQAYDRQEDALDRRDSAYDRLSEMILTMGYEPEEAELEAAGMSGKHRDSYLNYYKLMQTPKSGGSGKTQAEKDYDKAMAAAQKALKKNGDVEAVNGDIARQVARGELDVQIARRIIVELTNQVYG